MRAVGYFGFLLVVLLSVRASGQIYSIGADQCLQQEIPAGENRVSVKLTNNDGSSFTVYYISDVNPPDCDTSEYLKRITDLTAYSEIVTYDFPVSLSSECQTSSPKLIFGFETI